MSVSRLLRLCAVGLLATLAAPGGTVAGADPQATGGPVLVVETVKGTFEIQTYPNEAPRTVEHVLALVKRNFYRGLRFHRVEKGFVVQVGDPQTRNVTLQDNWGRGPASGSGQPIGVAEFSKTLTHKKGAVAMAHAGDAAQADSQFYVMLGARRGLDGQYTIWGQVTSGMEVVEQIEVGDVLKRITVKGS